MQASEQHAGTIDLFPIRYPDGETRFVPFSEFTLAVVVNLTQRAITGIRRMATVRPELLVLFGCGAVVVLAAAYDEHGEKRRK